LNSQDIYFVVDGCESKKEAKLTEKHIEHTTREPPVQLQEQETQGEKYHNLGNKKIEVQQT